MLQRRLDGLGAGLCVAGGWITFAVLIYVAIGAQIFVASLLMISIVARVLPLLSRLSCRHVP